jgi:hypothetical protein
MNKMRTLNVSKSAWFTVGRKRIFASGIAQPSIAIFLAALLAACGGGGGSGTGTIGLVAISGQVIGEGLIEGALVCSDANANGKCDADETQTRSDTAGAYRLSIPKEGSAPLVAEVTAGRSRDSGAAVDTSFRMASPSSIYSTTITPYSTLVFLSAESDFPLAEDLTRNTLGLPPKFNINLSSAAATGSLTQVVAKSVVVALKGAGVTLDMSAPSALRQVLAAFPRALKDLPVLRIATKDAAPIVSKETYLDATFVLTHPLLQDQAATLNGLIRGRGHSTWGQPKNPYKVQFSNDANYARIPDVLGMVKNRNWALLADYFDRSLMRNKLAFSLGSSSVFADGLKWTPSGQHVEVYLNDAYVGVYLLAEDIRIDPARLNIKKMSSSASVNDVDGGYIVEVDQRLDCFNDGVINLQHLTPQGAPICIDKPDEGSITQNQLAYIKNLLNSVEQDIYGPSSLAQINMTSFADWYLIQELFRNVDAVFFSSDFMWKDTNAASNPADRLLNMGPLWDFDLSAGNVNYSNGWMTEGCWVANGSQFGRPNWMPRLFDNARFRDLVLSRWKQKRPGLEKFINASMDTYADRLELAQQRNFAVWPIFGVPLTNYYFASTYAQELAYVKSFLNQRMAWLDRAYASPENFNALCK